MESDGCVVNMRVICSWRLVRVRDESSLLGEGRMEITSGRSLRFVRWRQVGLLQGIVCCVQLKVGCDLFHVQW